MKIKSFRVRIAMLSVLCSCLVLLGSALVVADVLWRSEMNRADRFIGTMINDNLENGFRPPPWAQLNDDASVVSTESGAEGDEEGLGWDRQQDEGDRKDRDRGPGRPWRRPAWQRPLKTQSGNSDTSEPAVIYQYYDFASNGAFQSNNWPASLSGSSFFQSADGITIIKTVLADGKLWRVGAGNDDERSVIFGLDLEPAVTTIKQVASAFLVSIPVALILIALGAVFLAQRALRPVHDLTQLVERITARGLSERVESRVKDAEFEKLIQVFNEMMDRLERSFLQANRFSADAAHELRTPITVLQGHVERMLQLVEPGSPMQQNLGDMVDELHRIKSILEKLLLLARMDAGEFKVRLTPLDLSEMVESIAEDIQALAPETRVETRIEPGLRADADASLLETAIQNMGSNAVKYNLEKDGWIKIELAKHKDSAVLSIANTGPRIFPEEEEKIFDRFYRADKSRSRETDGLGLGLSLAREIVQAHHGSLRLAAAGGTVNRFELTIPLHGAGTGRPPSAA